VEKVQRRRLAKTERANKQTASLTELLRAFQLGDK